MQCANRNHKKEDSSWTVSWIGQFILHYEERGSLFFMLFIASFQSISA